MKKILHILLLSLLIVSCKKEKTVWQSDWAFPIVNDTLSLKNLVNDSTLSENVSGYYDLELKRTLFDLRVNDLIEIPDTTIQENFTISFLNLTLAPGFSFVNSTEEHVLNVPNNAQLATVILESGFIDVTVKNPVATKAIFNVLLPGVSKDGVSFSEQYIAPAGTNQNPGIVTTTLDLSGYTLDLTGLTGSEWNRLRSQITVSTDPQGPTVNMTNQDITQVDAAFRDIRIAYARGYFGKQLVSDTVDLDLEALNIYAGGLLDIPSTSIEFRVENGVKVASSGLIHFVNNQNNLGNTVSLNSPQIGIGFNINPATGSWDNLTPTFKSLAFSSMNSNIESYIENLGNKHSVGYTFTLNPWGNVSGGWDEIFPHSRMRVDFLASMPLQIGLDDLVLRDTFEVDLNQDPEKTRVIGGEILLKVKNAFPFAAETKLTLLNANLNTEHTVLSSNTIQSSVYGSVEAASGLFVKTSDLAFVLPQNVLEDINNVKYIVVEMRLNSPDVSSGVSIQQPIPVGAFMGVQLRTNFKTENVY